MSNMSSDLKCPHCGLVMTLSKGPGGPQLHYDTDEWKRRCKYPELKSPALCLTERNPGDASKRW